MSTPFPRDRADERPDPVDRARLAALLDRERATYRELHPRSAAVHAAAEHLFGRVPMTWMNMWSGGFPLSFHPARGNRGTDGDGIEDVDPPMGGTGAKAGHNPGPTGAAGPRRGGGAGGGT